MPVTKKRENDKHSLSNYIDYLDIIDNKIFFEDLRTGIVLKSSFIYDEVLSDNEKLEKQDKIKNLLNAVKEDENIQVIFEKNTDFNNLINEHLSINKSKNPKVIDLFNSREKKIRQEIEDDKLFSFNIYFVISKQFESKTFNIRDYFYTDQKINFKIANFFKKTLDKLKDIESYYINYFEKLKLDIEKPSEQETIDFLVNQINFSLTENHIFKTKEDLVKSDLQRKDNYLKINDKYVKILTFKNRPEQTVPTIIKKLMLKDLNFEYRIVLNIKKLDKENQKSKIKIERNVKSGLKQITPGNFQDEDKAKDEENLSKLLHSMTYGNENIFHLEMLIVVTAESKKQLARNIEKIEVDIKQLNGAEIYEESIANFPLYLSSLPANSKFDNYRNMRVRTTYLADLIPIFGTPKSTGKPLMLFRNKFESLTALDPFNKRYPSWNGIIAGTTGSGKSFMTSTISANFLAYDPIITIIDKGGSYKKFINNLEGDYFEVSADSRINPFDLPIEKKTLFWQNILESMVRDEGQVITNDDKIILERIIRNVDKNLDRAPIVSDFIEQLEKEVFEEQVLKDIQKKYIRYLKRFTRGERGSFLNNRKSNINVNSSITGIDLKGLEDYKELMEIFMFYITGLIWHKAKQDEDRRKLFILDEVWSLMMTEQGAKLLKDLYRTLRKYSASIFSISQSINDFANENFQRDIMENISFVYILEQAQGAKFDKIKSALNLTDPEIKKIRHVETIKGEYADIFVKTPDLKGIVRLVPTPYEYWLATTSGADKKLFKDTLKEKNDNLRETLYYLAENYPNGTFGKKENK